MQTLAFCDCERNAPWTSLSERMYRDLDFRDHGPVLIDERQEFLFPQGENVPHRPNLCLSVGTTEGSQAGAIVVAY